MSFMSWTYLSECSTGLRLDGGELGEGGQLIQEPVMRGADDVGQAALLNLHLLLVVKVINVRLG